jgi:Rv2525c-like, glycoside hydrolase-like domain
MMLGLDYAGGRPGGSAISAAGYRFTCRYLSSGGSGLPGKLLTADEYADLQSHGVAVVCNWETTADRMKGGYRAGVSDARQADAQIQVIGHPSHRPIMFSADWDVSLAEQSQVDDYLRGAASVIGIDRVGVYGSYYVCKRCLDNHTATWAWQAMAWSGGQVEPRAHIVQRIATVTVGGIQCDVNEAMRVDFGQHPAGEDDMTPDEMKKVLAGDWRPDPNHARNPVDMWIQTVNSGFDTQRRLSAIEAALATLISAVTALAAVEATKPLTKT